MAKSEIKVKVTTVGDHLAMDLAQLVELMRDAQEEYFKTRSQNALQNAKDLEKRVDQTVEKMLHPEKARGEDIPGQTDLFGDPGPYVLNQGGQQ